MTTGPLKVDRKYPLVGPDAKRPPDYGRVVRMLSDDELADDLRLGRGDEGYREALDAERDRREREA